LLIFCNDSSSISLKNWQDELEVELEELEGVELESQLLEPVAAPPVHPVQVPANRQPTRPVPQKATAEDDELAALQAEMALWSGYIFTICFTLLPDYTIVLCSIYLLLSWTNVTLVRVKVVLPVGCIFFRYFLIPLYSFVSLVAEMPFFLPGNHNPSYVQLLFS
jgi:hypothetical protein